MTKSINHLDLFSGIGGFSLGLRQAGVEPNWVGFSDIDESANKVFKRRFPNARQLNSITTIQPEELPNIDLITFGFPCQDLSNIGTRGGVLANRSGLFYKATEIIKVKRPKYFVFENVKGLLSINKGQDFVLVLKEISDIGYDGQWQLLNSRNFGLPQNRERVYFVGHIREESRPKVFPFGEDGELSTEKSRNDTGKAKGVSNEYTRCINSRIWKMGCEDSYVRDAGRLRRLTPNECSRLQGFSFKNEDGSWDDTWNDIGISDTQRYKQLGNAVSVPVVKAVMERIYGKEIC